MKVITAPQDYEPQEHDIRCFLAGGITNCHDWQKEVIEYLQYVNPGNLIIFNPRRENFPINDPNAAKEQITWEFENLNKADIFSMYFCSGESDQPICMYELGRHLERMLKDYPFIEIFDRIVVSVEDGYRRKNDVIIQTELAFGSRLAFEYPDDCFVTTHATPFDHAGEILIRYAWLKFGDTNRFDDKLKEYRKAMHDCRRTRESVASQKE